MDLLLAMRPRQWTKNLLVFGGLIFSAKFTDSVAFAKCFWMFVCFCLVSSAGYLFNDVADIKGDRAHPEKKDRPIASGNVSVPTALACGAILLIAGTALAGALRLRWGVELLGLYALNQAFYMLVARKVAILDVFVISIGFLLRAIAGAAVISVGISSWLLIVTFMLALFLGFAKRRHEFLLGTESRTSLTGYSEFLLNQIISITAASTIIAYSVYAIESNTAHEHPLLVLTVPFPLFGVFRYLQLVYQKDEGGSPDRALIKDPWLFGTVIAWAVVCLLAVGSSAGASR